ncbi:MAG: enoyl-CoA hydratase/isomerase family protein [Bacteroidales bacterium]|jgi:enoyl-CoA hydratase|nr:enoyl-CoA hydratase/isomerase family protein [Bacteroidales bacterium]
MDYSILKPSIEGSIAVLTISRPQALNALNSVFFNEMDHYLSSVSGNPDIRVLIITGEGKAFVAGADIAEMVNMSPAEARVFSAKGQAVFNKIGELGVPVIAAINGFALGGGMELAMACDFRIASSLAKFGQPEVNLGLIPGYAGTQRLPRLTNLADALYLLTTGEVIDAATALQMRLIQKVTEPTDLMAEAMRLAGLIAAKGPLAVKLVKQVTRQGLGMEYFAAEKLEQEHFGDPFGGQGAEGMRAFLEKRKPVW